LKNLVAPGYGLDGDQMPWGSWGIYLGNCNGTSHLISQNTIEIPRSNIDHVAGIFINLSSTGYSGTISENLIYDAGTSNSIYGISGIRFLNGSNANTWDIVNNQVKIENPGG